MVSKLLIGSANVAAGGCDGASQDFQFGIPHIKDLDESYTASHLPGVEFVYAINGMASISNIRFLPSDGGVGFTLSAHGNGTREPLTGACLGAAGADIHIQVFAHYK